MTARRTRRARALGAAMLLLTLTACTDPGGPAPTITLEAVDPPAPIDATTIGLVEASSESDGSEPGVGAATTALAFFPELAARASDFLAAIGASDVGVLDVVAADRQVLGIEVRPDDGHAPDVEHAGAVLYGDVVSGATWTARDLMDDASARELEDAVRAALAGDAGAGADGTEAEAASSSSDTVGDEADLLADVRFSPAGDLVVVAPRGDRAWRVASPAEVTLSDAGRLVRGTARQGGEFLASITSDPLPVTPATVPLPPVPLPPEPPPPPAAGPVAPDCAVAKCVAITFDDGPGPETPRLLQILADHQARATFYLVGRRVGPNAATAKAIADAGHALGNHTWSHPDLTTADAATRASEIAETTRAISEATGRAPTTMRPPYGAVNDDVRADLAADGLPGVLWSVDSLDWKSKDAEATTTEVMAQVKPGSIVLLHDIHATTVDAVPGILEQLTAQGYTFVTVDELLPTMQPGETHFSRS